MTLRKAGGLWSWASPRRSSSAERRSCSSRGFGELHRDDQVGSAVAIEVRQLGRAKDVAPPGKTLDRLGGLGRLGRWAAGTVGLGAVGPEQRPVRTRQGEDRGGGRKRPDEVACAVAIQVGGRSREEKCDWGSTRKNCNQVEGSRPGCQALCDPTASQITLPFTALRRINEVDVDSMKFTVPGFSSSAAVIGA